LLLALPELLAPTLRACSNAGPLLINAVRFGAATLLLLVPTVAMGMTLPILVGGMTARGIRFGRALGWLYGLNTLGAVSGVLVAELLLVGKLGLGGSAAIAGTLNLIAASCALLLNYDPNTAPPQSPTTSRPRAAMAYRLLAAAFMSGFLLLGLEVLWFRFISLFVTNNTLSLALMLAGVLAGIGVGGVAGGVAFVNAERASRALPCVAAAAGLAVSVLFRLFSHALVESHAFAWQAVVRYVAVLALPPAFLSGLLFTLQGTSLNRSCLTSEGASSLLTVSNTIGASLGAF